MFCKLFYYLFYLCSTYRKWNSFRRWKRESFIVDLDNDNDNLTVGEEGNELSFISILLSNPRVQLNNINF
jgi:hypothetical protein